MKLRSGKIINKVDRELLDAAHTLLSFNSDNKVKLIFTNKKIPKELLIYKKCLNRVIKESLKKGINIKFEKL